MNIDDRSTDHSGRPIHTFLKISNGHTLATRHPSCFVLGWDFRGRWIERRYFPLDQIHDGGWRPFIKLKRPYNVLCLQRIVQFALCTYTDLSLASDTTIVVNPLPSGWRRFPSDGCLARLRETLALIPGHLVGLNVDIGRITSSEICQIVETYVVNKRTVIQNTVHQYIHNY